MTASQARLHAWEHDATLDVPDSLRARADVLDRLETYFPEAFDVAGVESSLRQRATALRERLEAANRRLYAELRGELARGEGRARLLQWSPKAWDAAMSEDGYDYLDELVDGVLDLEPPGAVAGPAAEMVFYQPTPARHIFDLVARARPT